MKNKKMLLFAGVLAAFLMLAVPFAVVSFDSDNADATDVSGNYQITTVNGLTVLNVTANAVITAADGLELNGLKVTVADGVDVTIVGIKTVGTGILVTGSSGAYAGDVVIKNCSVSDVLGSSNILKPGVGRTAGIEVQYATDITIGGIRGEGNNVTSILPSATAMTGYGIVAEYYTGDVKIAYNTVEYTSGNAIYAYNASGVGSGCDVTIEGNDVSYWGQNPDGINQTYKGGRAIRAGENASITVTGNDFTTDGTSSEGAGDIMKVDKTPVVSFNNNTLSGSGIPCEIDEEIEPGNVVKQYFVDAGVSLDGTAEWTSGENDHEVFYWYNVEVNEVEFPSKGIADEVNVFGNVVINVENMAVETIKVTFGSSVLVKNGSSLDVADVIGMINVEAGAIYNGNLQSTDVVVDDDNQPHKVIEVVVRDNLSSGYKVVTMLTGKVLLEEYRECLPSEESNYVFDGYYTQSGQLITESTVVSESLTEIVAVYDKVSQPGISEYPYFPESGENSDNGTYVIIAEIVVAVIVLFGLVAIIRKN